MKQLRRSLLLPVVVTLSTLALAGPADRILLAPEVQFVEFRTGDTFEVVGRYGSMLGTDLTIDSCSIPIAVPRDSRPDLFRREDLRKLLIRFEVEVVSVETAKPTLRLLDAVAADSVAKHFAQASAAKANLTNPHLRAIALWVLDEAHSARNAKLARSAKELLLETLTTDARSLPSDRAFTEEDIEWFHVGREHLDSEPRWSGLVIATANRHRTDAVFAKNLSENGYLPTAEGWKLRSQFLAAVGLRDVDGVAVSEERALLEDALANWEGIRRSSQLLRGLTSQQYESHAARGDVVSGMTREEVVRTWRYPANVSWVKREKRVFEIWTWQERFVCFADGLVFEVHNEG